MEVLTGGVEDVLEASSSPPTPAPPLAAQVLGPWDAAGGASGFRKCSRTSSRNSAGYWNTAAAFSIMNDTMRASSDASAVNSCADICATKGSCNRLNNRIKVSKSNNMIGNED